MTPSASEPVADARDRLIAGYASLAILLQVFEAGLPSPLPGVKPGLANVIVLIALLRYGWRVAAAVSLLRVLAASLLIGSFLTPSFWLSAAGAMASLAALAMGQYWNRGPAALRLSALGLSVLSGLAHMSGQFALAYIWLLPHPGLWRLLPMLLGAALILSVLSGLIALRLLRKLPPPADLRRSF